MENVENVEFNIFCRWFVHSFIHTYSRLEHFLEKELQNLRINKCTIFMMLAENELPLFERPAAATDQHLYVYIYIYNV